MALTYSDELTARFCPRCYAIPCRCSRLTRLLESLIRLLEATKQRRYLTRQRVLRDE